MNRSSLPAIVALSLALSACVAPSQVQRPQPGGQLELTLASGTYGCEDGERVHIERDIRDRVNYRIHVGWHGRHYRLERDASYSGLPRFEDASSGLVWIDMPSKSLLLDGKDNKPLANECRPV